MNILVLNAGSSSLKFRLIEMGETGQESVLANGLVEKWGTPQALLKLEVSGKPPEEREVAAETSAHAAEHAIQACADLGIDALGHRVVHGGARFREPARITPDVVAAIREVSHLAPLHNELALAGIEAGQRLLPSTPAVAVFDTAFHRTIPDVAALYAIPLELSQQHQLRRYGFHGISHRYVSQELLECLGRPAAGTRLITCHLGNGASVCAIRDGQSIDTSMGLTPMEGLVMGTRSGDIDPGLLLHLLRELRMPVDDLDELLNRRSGLLGLSGRSADMRDVEQAAGAGDARAERALEIFAYRIRKYIGAYAVVLGGVDAIAFAGGIGEHSSQTRLRVCRELGYLGVAFDAEANASAPADRPVRLSAPASSVQVWMIPTDEERQIAREVRHIFSTP